MRGRKSQYPESVYPALNFKHVRMLRKMLAQGPDFRDWKWSQKATGTRGGIFAGDWFQVDKARIDENDPDCVSREKEVLVLNRNREGGPDPTKSLDTVIETKWIYEMWSPVSAVALLMKVEMPLRTFQVRMLDSGETDPSRVDIIPAEEKHFLTTDGKDAAERQSQGNPLFKWVPNDGRRKALLNGLNLNDANRVGENRGVFAHGTDDKFGEYVGFFVNTNKTADIDVVWHLRGYRIAWQHHSLHRWLIKLRNWQMKYNPIAKPTLWTELMPNHLGKKQKLSQAQEASPTCFLFRDASAQGKSRTDDERKPVVSGKMETLWGKLLFQLEKDEEAAGVRGVGQPLRFVKTWAQGAPSSLFYPLHALRTTMITVFVDGGMSLDMVMRIAGHTRLVMTIYYKKHNIHLINQELAKVHKKLAADEDKLMADWLLNLPYEQLDRFVVADRDGLRLALAQDPRNRTAVQFERHLGGWCLMGGNVAPVADNRQIGGCFNGGRQITGIAGKSAKQARTYEGVRPKACIECRCRWFATRPGYILEIKARMDILACNLSVAQSRKEMAEEMTEKLVAEKHRALEEQRELQKKEKGAAFTFAKQDELTAAEQLFGRAETEVQVIETGLSNGAQLTDALFRLAELPDEPGATAPREQLIVQGSPDDVKQALAGAAAPLLSLAGLTQQHGQL